LCLLFQTGKWAETASGIGSNSDSFYEYIIKSHFLFGTESYDTVFAETYLAVKRFNQLGDWFADVDMHSGKVRRQMAENLQAFWPGVESSLGLTRTSARFLNALYSVLAGVGVMPEEFDYLRWKLPGTAGSVSYLLRPELIESTYQHYRSTLDRSWLTAGKWFLQSVEEHAKTGCGYAAVDRVDSMGLADAMPSYFLAETVKYLYLLFDEDHFVHTRPFIFSTEAHLFDASVLNRIHSAHTASSSGQRQASFAEDWAADRHRHSAEERGSEAEAAAAEARVQLL
jgi:mannosidase alpha-like ER degradation enhancer 2